MFGFIVIFGLVFGLFFNKQTPKPDGLDDRRGGNLSRNFDGSITIISPPTPKNWIMNFV